MAEPIPMKLLFLILVSTTIAVLPPIVAAATILGNGTGALLGSDLTDPENDDLAATGSIGYAGNSQFTLRHQVIRFDGGGVDFPAPAAYGWFRLNVDSSAGWVGAGGQASLSELELFGTAIPEPSSLALLGLAGLGLGLIRCRK